MKRRILIMGTPVAPGNRGVMALGASLVDLLTTGQPDIKAEFLQVHKPAADVLIRTAEGARKVRVITCRMSPRSPLRDHLIWILMNSLVYRTIPIPKLRDFISLHSPWIKAVREADLVGDIRGGDSFSDIYGMKRFVLAFLPILTVILIRRNIVCFPQTYGPYSNRVSRAIARWILRRSSVIIARDTRSQAVAQVLVGSERKVLLSPDVAFALQAVDVPNPVLNEDSQANPFYPPSTIGINVNGLLYHGGYTGKNEFELKLDYPTFIHELILRLLERTQADVLLVSHTYAVVGDVESDNAACTSARESLPESLRKRVRLVAAEYDAHELKGIIGTLDFFIGSRMHACIAALSQGVPCVGVAYSMKFAGVFESVGMGEWVVDARKSEVADAINQVLQLYCLRDHVREDLAINVESAVKTLTGIFTTLINSSAPVPGVHSPSFQKVLPIFEVD
jgi:polysaccharide pyruvyl transferase WcaK-like protein